MNFKMTSSCCTIVDKSDHVQYLQFQRAIPDDCTCSLIEQNIAINDHVIWASTRENLSSVVCE